MLYEYSFIRHFLSGFCLLLALASPLSAAESGHVAPININTASAASLADALQGVGQTRAKEIVAYRKNHGPFAKPADLANVKGIGKATVDRNLSRIQVK